MEFIAQGKVLSKVDCHIERQKQAERSNTHIDEVPLKYGSVRLGVNLIQFEGVTYTINRASIDKDIKEERLILEISYKFDSEGNIVSEHEIINEFNIGDNLELDMDSAFISKQHYLKLINVGIGTTIKSYFIKSWANRIDFLNVAEMEGKNNFITPKTIVQKISQDKSLIIV